MPLSVRLAADSDAATIAAIYQPYVEDSHFTFEQVAPDAVEIAARLSNPAHPWLLAEESGRVVGYASTSPLRDRAAYRWSADGKRIG